MTSANFAAAQQRLLERRQRREAESHARLLEQQQSASRINSAALSRLPGPLGKAAQSGLSVWNKIKGRDGTSPVFRVGQVDAELLDEELLGLLQGQVGEALKYFGVCTLSSI
jgi:peroxin-2